MRNVYFSVLLLSLFFLSAATTASADCTCYSMRTYNYTCTVDSCQQTITISSCYGIPQNCSQCVDAYNWIPCCGQQVGSAAIIGECGQAGLRPVAAAQDGPGSRAVRFYVPSCAGGFEPVGSL